MSIQLFFILQDPESVFVTPLLLMF